MKKIWSDCMRADGTQSHCCWTLVGAGQWCTMIGQSAFEGQDLAKGQFTKPAYFFAGGSRSTGRNLTQALEEHVNSNVKYMGLLKLSKNHSDTFKYNLKSRASACTTYCIYLYIFSNWMVENKNNQIQTMLGIWMVDGWCAFCFLFGAFPVPPASRRTNAN